MSSVHDNSLTEPSTLIEDTEEVKSTSSWETNSVASNDQEQNEDSQEDEDDDVDDDEVTSHIIEAELDGLRSLKSPTLGDKQFPPVLALLKAYDKDASLTKGLPALLEDVAKYCDNIGLKSMQAICQSFAVGPQTLRFAISYGEFKTLKDLPNEILAMIAERCDKETLRIFRLVSKKHGDVGAQYLFSPIMNVIMTLDGLRKLRTVARHKLIPKGISKLRLYFGDWSHIKTRGTWNQRIRTQHCSSCDRYKPPNPNTIINKQYSQFRKFKANQHNMEDSNKDIIALTAALKTMKHLQTVEIYGGLSMYTDKEVQECYEKLTTEIGAPPNFDTNCTRSFIRTLQAAHAAGIKIKVLRCEKIAIGFLASEDVMMLSAIKNAFFAVEEIDLSIDLSESLLFWKDEVDHTLADEALAARMTSTAGMEGLLSKFLHSARDLTKLVINFGSSMKLQTIDSAFSMVFGISPWTKLESLVICGSCGTVDQHLSLIRRHRKTLIHIGLTSLSTLDIGWDRFWEGLRRDVAAGKFEKLKTVSLHGAWEWLDAGYPQILAKHLCGPGGEDDDHVLGEMLSRFILEGGENPWSDAAQELVGLPFPF